MEGLINEEETDTGRHGTAMCLCAMLEGHGTEVASSPAHQGVWVEMRDLEPGQIQTERNYLYFFFKNENEKAFFKIY